MKYLLITLVLLIASFNYAQEKNDWKFSAQIQLRSELDGRDFNDESYALTFASMRSRFAVQKSFDNSLDFMLQIQDSRVFGQENSTLANSYNLDLHQAFVRLKNPLDLPVSIQAGRFQVAYGTERFFGAVGWHYVGRAFNGVRASFDLGNFTDVFALSLREPTGYISNPTSSLYPEIFLRETSSSIYGFWSSTNLSESQKLDFFGYHEIDRRVTVGDDYVLSQSTLGLNHIGTFGAFSNIVEAAYQFGNRGANDVSAYLISLQGSYKYDVFKFGVGGDILSGSSSDDLANFKENSFSVLYGTNHKFYGYMDYFINVPANTRNLGLNNFYLMFDWMPTGSKFSTSLMIHQLSSNQESALGNSAFGQEIDLTVFYRFIKGTTVTFGTSLFLPGDLMKEFFTTPTGTVRDDMSFWSYIMLTTNI